MIYNHKTILNDLKVPCRCGGPAKPDTHNLHMCGTCNGTGFLYFQPNCNIYLDLDGVCAGFDEGFETRFGIHPAKISDNAMWDAIHGCSEYWHELPVMTGAYEFCDWIKPLQPQVLTACPEKNYQEAAYAKKHWVRTKLPGDFQVLPVRGGAVKPLFMHQVGDILIDDYGKNIEMWEDAGGIGIKHAGDFNKTKQTLITILKEKHQYRQ